MHQQLKEHGVTLELLWREYQQEPRNADEKVYQYSRFCDLYHNYARQKGLTMALNHKPGEEAMVDWAGDTMSLTDPETGAKAKVYIFVAVLPYSMYTFALGCPDMSEQSWIKAHIAMYNSFRGVSRLLICDNTKTAVIHNRKAEPVVLNKTYVEMASYYGAAVLPTRVRRPKDKAAAESSVKLVTQHIIAPLRNTVFFTLDELNGTIQAMMAEENERPFQKRPGSRLRVFLEEERAFLKPLPSKPFQIPVWRTATVQKNYHVTINGANYSVPYTHVGRKVDIRCDDEKITVYFEGVEIAVHSRDDSARYHTQQEHMPYGHRMYREWNAGRFLRWAESKGASVREVVRRILASYEVEEQAYKTLFALLNLPKKFTRARLEPVCEEILSSGTRPTLQKISSLMQKVHEEALQSGTLSVPSPAALVRGSSYYSMNRQEEPHDC